MEASTHQEPAMDVDHDRPLPWHMPRLWGLSTVAGVLRPSPSQNRLLLGTSRETSVLALYVFIYIYTHTPVLKCGNFL